MDIYDKYLDNIKELHILTEAGVALSNSIKGRKTDSQGDINSSLVFNKMLAHVMSIQRLLPESNYFNKETSHNIYDLSSVCSLTRSVIDAYLTMYYLSFDKVSENERDFRFALWNYHGECRRLEKLELIGSKADELQKIRDDKDHYLKEIDNNPFLEELNASKKKDIRSGKMGIYASNSDICKNAGINPNYYKVVFKYLSSYVHTYPFAITQLSALSNDPKGIIPLIKGVIDYLIGFFCAAINDYSSLFEDTKDQVKNCQETIDFWLYVHRNFNGVNT